jgi:hypothetical protein
MDSEMYSDFTGSHKHSEGPYFVETEQLKKKDSTWHKTVAESLGKLFDKVIEVDATVGKRLDALAATISESKSASEKPPDLNLKTGSELQDIAVAEVNQLLSDVEGLKNDLTGTEKGIVQSGGGYPIDVDSRLALMQVQIDALKDDVKLVSENLMNLMSYFKARGTNKPLSIKGGMQDGKFVIHAVERG